MRNLSYIAGGALLCATLPFAPASAATFNTLTGEAPIVIAHRGAPAYLPENTIGGNELSAEMGSHYIETDVMLTKDGVMIAMHDASLARTTNVEDFYAPRNGGYNVADFTYEEISALTVNPTGSGDWTYPGFTPSDDNPYRVPTFADMLDALTAYNEANGTNVGMLTELKYSYNPTANAIAMETLAEKGYTTADKSLVQSFDFQNVAEVAQINADAGLEMGFAQLGNATLVDGEWFVSNTLSFAELATYTDTVALYFGSVTEDAIAAAHALGLSVYAWTFRPSDLENAFALASNFLDWGLDGFITDNPDYIASVIDAQAVAPVPLPAALPLMIAGVAGLAGLRLRRKAA